MPPVAHRPAAPSAVRTEPCPYLARALYGGRLVAASRSAIRVDRAGEAPVLCFPTADVRLELFEHEGPASGRGAGTAERWGMARPKAGAPATPDGRGILVTSGDEPVDAGVPPGTAVFDHDRVQVELVDGTDDDDARDVTVKQFPTWGDAADLMHLLDLRAVVPLRYESAARSDHRRPVVEGSQMLGQAVVAAGRHAPGRRAVSASMVFLRAADAGRPLSFALEELSSGRTFVGLGARVTQGERLCAAGTLLLDRATPDLVRHAVPPPDVPGPYDSEPFDMGVTGRDIRVVGGTYTDDPAAPVGPPQIDAWVRFREVPDDEPLHAGLLAQFTGHMSIAAALRPHQGYGQRQAHRSLSTAVNAISLSVHGPVRVDRWLLYRHRSTFAGDGMTHAECRVHDEEGDLLASFTVEAMVRAFADPSAPVDPRTAL